MKLGNSVKLFRKHAGLKQSELAEIVGVSRQTILCIEKGKQNPSVHLALKVARTLGISVEAIFYETI